MDIIKETKIPNQRKGNEILKKNEKDKIRNDIFRQNLQIEPINEKNN